MLNCAKTGDTPKVVKEITSSNDNIYTNAVWGALNKTIYACTTNGKLLGIDVSSGKTLKEITLHPADIF